MSTRICPLFNTNTTNREIQFPHSMPRIRKQDRFTLACTILSDILSLSYGLLYPSIEQTTWASTIPKWLEQTAPNWLLCFISKRPSCGVWPLTRRTSEAKFKDMQWNWKKNHINTEIIINPLINSNNYLNILSIHYWLQSTCRW